MLTDAVDHRAIRLTDGELECLIHGAEDTRVEFTEALTDTSAERIREEICAFANDLPGSGEPGIAVVGLKDDGVPAGTPITDQMLLKLTDMRSDGNIVPPPVLLVEKRLHQGHEIAVITVHPSDSPPVRCKGRGSTSASAPAVELQQSTKSGC